MAKGDQTNQGSKGERGARHASATSPQVIDPSPELKQLRQVLEAGMGDLKVGLGTAVADAVRGQLEHQLLARLDQAVQQRFDRTSADLEARDQRVSDALAKAQQTVGAAETRLSVVSEDVLAERIQGAVVAATRSVADEVFQREFQRRLTELEGLFEDVDDQFAKVRAYVEHFGPGGLPVLVQRVEAEAAHRAQLSEELDQAHQESKRLREHIDDLESDRRRWKAAEGIDPEVVDRKLLLLDKQERDLADRQSLSGENQRLARDLQALREELNRWRQLDLADQRAQADQRALQQAIEDRDAADNARDQAEHRLSGAMAAKNRLERQVESLEQTLVAQQADAAAADQRERRLEALTEQNADLKQLHEDARALVAEQERQIDQLRVERQALTIALSDAEDRVTQARNDARLELVKEEAAKRSAERQRLLEWAEEEAQLRSSAHVSRADLLETRQSQLTTHVEGLTGELVTARGAIAKLDAQNTALQAQLAALEDSVVERKRMLEEEAQTRAARTEAERTELFERVRTEARAVGVREADAARKDADDLDERARELEKLIDEREARVHELVGEAIDLQGQRGQLQAELDGLERRIDELRLRDVPDEERLADLHSPVFKGADLQPIDPEPSSESDWLADLERRIRGAGFAFHPRLVRAFHTSLKIADQAPLAVLAGISGTGKSELPRLYADLGGLPFLELAVQPRWDSPDDLFGFFNYTDGRLKAEPLARLFHQLGQVDDPLQDGPVIVLLDEMNIARVEYYFSDLLSKLESRRTVARTGTDDARKRASIRLSAGSSGGELFLYPDERVLFVGTMNEDESTLTLSDKVLDRASVLTFPAPRDMTLREQGRVERRDHRLPWTTWTAWRDRETTADVATELNLVNDLMESVGRPFGHRLFRAIHAYIASYPADTASNGSARAHALSDQFAMKILPRLRGLECGDRHVTQALDGLREHLPDDLVDSFGAARDREFFAWAGAADLYRMPEGT